LINALVSSFQLLHGKAFIGLPGNLNWHAALVLGLSPLVCNQIKIRVGSKNHLLSRIFQGAVVIFTGFSIIKAESRAAILSVFIVALVYIFLVFYKNPRIYRVIIFSFCVIGLISLILGVIFSKYIADILFYDMRVAMWTGALRLINDNALFGVGEQRFLSEYMVYRPIGYFLRSHHFAHITEHPHNHVLYIFSCFGLLGAIPYMFLIICPLFVGLRRFDRLSTTSRSVILSFLFYLICSFFDMTYYQWHNFFIISALLGLVWRIGFPTSPIFTKSSPCNSSLFFLGLRICASSILFAAFVYTSVVSFLSSVAYYQGYFISEESGRRSEAILNIDAAVNLDRNFSTAFFSAGVLSMQDFKDPYMAESYLDRLQECPSPTVSRSNLKMADAKIAMGRRLDALRFLEKDILCYPISIESLYKKAKIEEELGRSNELNSTLLRLSRALEHKGLSAEDAPVIAKNSYFDNKFEEYKKLKKELLKKREIEKSDLRATN